MEKGICIYESDLSEYISERMDPQKLHIIICRSGYAVFSFNQRRFAVSAGCMLIVSSDLITTIVQTSRTFRAECMDITNDIVQEAALTINPDLITALYHNPVIKPDNDGASHMTQWFELFKWALEKVNSNKSAQLIRNQLQSLLFILENTYPYDKFSETKGLSSRNRIFFDFCSLICEMCHKEHKVQFYADKLYITPYYLSRITAMMAGISPKRMIDEQLIAEAKHLLLYTELTINEIADRLFFDSATYFCKFFRKFTGTSPVNYRSSHN